MPEPKPFPELAPDHKVSIAFPHWVVVHQWHKSQSGKSCNPDKTRASFDFYIERIDDMHWYYNVLYGVNYDGLFELTTHNILKIGNVPENYLYTPGITTSVSHSVAVQNRKEFEKYASLNAITEIPPAATITAGIDAKIQGYVTSNLEKTGYVSHMNPLCFELLVNTVSNPELDFIFDFTFTLIKKLIYHPAFNNENNIKQITKTLRHAHLITLEHKCRRTFGNNKLQLNVIDSALLALQVEMSLQCVVGRIWEKLEPLMEKEGFSKEKVTDFITKGKNFFLSAKNAMEKSVVNFSEFTPWDDLVE